MRESRMAATLARVYRALVLAAVVLAVVVAPTSALAASWLPHPADATWTWQWTDSVYSQTPTTEKVTVKEQKGASFTLGWTTSDLGNAADAVDSEGTMVFQETSSGIVNTDWSSTAPPAEFPILCSSASRCGNSLTSVLYQVIWGARSPVLSLPLVRGASWSSTGGANADVTSTSTYLGQEKVSVPAFPQPVTAAKVRSDVTQAGALGDPYGSGVRTIWWVSGVGPVKIVFEHAGGTKAAVTTAVLQTTNQQPDAATPIDANYFPLKQGAKTRYSWTNTKWLKKKSVTEFSVAQVQNNSARVDVKHISGPIRLAGSYGFALRTDGLTNIFGSTKAASLAKFPQLGPRFLAADKRRHFFTPYDLMIYGLNPILPDSTAAGTTWSVGSTSGRDWQVFGVTGTSKVLGLRKVTVPGGTFNALAVQSTLKQSGYAYGSGTRTSYFA